MVERPGTPLAVADALIAAAASIIAVLLRFGMELVFGQFLNVTVIFALIAMAATVLMLHLAGVYKIHWANAGPSGFIRIFIAVAAAGAASAVAFQLLELVVPFPSIPSPVFIISPVFAFLALVCARLVTRAQFQSRKRRVR